MKAPYVACFVLCIVFYPAVSAPSMQMVFAQEQNSAGQIAADRISEKISIDLKGIDIIEFFRILSVKMGVTIVPSKSVSGRVNIFLNNLTFQDALDVVLASQDLACERNGGVINVMTASEYAKLYGTNYKEKRKFKAIKPTYAKPATVFNALTQIKSDIGKLILDETSATILVMDTSEKIELMENTVKELDQPVPTEVFELQYAKPEDIKTQLSGIITAGPGELLADQRSTKVVISDLPGKMKKIRRIISAFDSEIPQVRIETTIIELTRRDEYQRQISWERLFMDKKLKNLDFKGTFPVSSSFSPSPSLSTANQTISMGTLTSDDYTATLKFLETLGDTRIVSQPQIVAANNQEAKIMVGSKEAYVIQTLSQGTSSTVSGEDIQFIDVGVKLNVAPTINKDGFVTMRIKPEVSSVRETITTTLGSRIPIIDTSEVETAIKVKDGTIIMIAGLTKQDNRLDTSGFPILSHLPFVGSAAGSRARLKKTTEFIIFLSPHIIRGDVNTTAQDLKNMQSKELAPELSKQAATPVIGAEAVIPKIDIQEKMKGQKELGFK